MKRAKEELMAGRSGGTDTAGTGSGSRECDAEAGVNGGSGKLRASESRSESESEGASETLASAARRAGVHVGAAVMPDLLQHDDAYRRTLQREFNAVVVEHHMKWAPMSEVGNGRLGCYDFGPADVIVDWARSREMHVKAHTLVWHVTSPAALKGLAPAQIREEVRRHIFTTCGHYYNRVHSWDVVNEALAPDGSLASTFLGLDEALIDDCFRWARLADPNAELLYNDNKVEGMGVMPSPGGVLPGTALAHRKKSDCMYELLRGMKERNVPVDGVGLQAHLNTAGVALNRPPPPSSVRANVSRLADLGLSVNFSEVDVRVGKLPGNMAVSRDAAQRQVVFGSLRAAMQVPNFSGVTYWGVSDAHTWVTDFYWAGDAPLLFDREYKRKEAYFGALDALRMARTPRVSDAELDRGWGEGWAQLDPQDAPTGVTGASASSSSVPDWELPQ